MKYPMSTIRKSRLESSHELVLTAGAWLESAQPSLDAIRDRMVETDVEVKEWKFFKASPISTIQHVRGSKVESASHHSSLNTSFYPFHPMAETLPDLLEEGWL